MILKAAVLGSIENDPQQVLELLKDNDFKGILDPQDRKDWTERAKERLGAVKKLTEQRQLNQVIENHSETFGKLIDGTLSLSDIENIPDDKARKYLTDAFLKINPASPEAIFQKQAELQVKFEDFFEKDRNGQLTDRIKQDKTASDVLALQYDYMKALRDGVVTKSQLMKQAKQYPDFLKTVLDSRNQKNPILSALISGINVFRGVAGSFIRHFGDNVKAGDKIKAQMTESFLDRLNKLDPENTDEILGAIDATVKEYQVRQNPNRSRYPVNHIEKRGSQAFQVTGYDESGNPVFKKV